MIGFEYAQAIHDNLAEPDTDVCAGCEDNGCEECAGDCCRGCSTSSCTCRRRDCYDCADYSG